MHRRKPFIVDNQRELMISRREEPKERRRLDRIHKIAQPLVRDCGISVFRVVDNSSLDQIMDTFATTTRGTIHQQRGFGNENNASINLMQMREVQDNARLLGDMSIRTTIDAIYDGIPSLRQKLELETESIKLFGKKQTPMRAVVMGFTEESQERLRDERQQILSIIERESYCPPEDFAWLTFTEPHVSIGRIHRDTHGPVLAHILNELDTNRPQTISVERAIIHNPTHR